MASRQINNNARDVKRRIDQIQKKCAELKSLGVAIGVAYSSHKTNGLYVFGDRRITKVIEKYKDDILLDADWMEEDDEEHCEPSVILPPLPAKVEQLNSVTKKALIRGLIKDLGLKWSAPTPAWWPEDVPYRNVTTPPDGYTGKLYCS